MFKGSSGTTWRHRRNWWTGRSCELTLHAWFNTGLRFFVHFGELLNIVCPTKGEKGDAGYEGIPGFQGVKVFILHFCVCVWCFITTVWFDSMMLLGSKRNCWCEWACWTQRKAGGWFSYSTASLNSVKAISWERGAEKSALMWWKVEMWLCWRLRKQWDVPRHLYPSVKEKEGFQGHEVLFRRPCCTCSDLCHWCVDRALWEILEREALLDRRGSPYVPHINHDQQLDVPVSID